MAETEAATYLFPVPPRHVVKWERWRTWTEEFPLKQSWISYQIRLTEKPVPEDLPWPVEHDPRRSYLAVDGLVNDGIFWTRFVTYRAMAHDNPKCANVLRCLVERGEIKQVVEGERYPVVCCEPGVYP